MCAVSVCVAAELTLTIMTPVLRRLEANRGPAWRGIASKLLLDEEITVYSEYARRED